VIVMANDPLTHFDADGAARMVDIEAKRETPRRAVAKGRVRMAAETLARIEDGSVGKGDVLAVARLAGIGAAKGTAQLIPLCHPVRLTAVDVTFEVDRGLPGVTVRAEVHAIDRTGPEMEAMTAASVAALTIYDMCKAMDRGMSIETVQLQAKSGGKSGDWTRGSG
jgi:cyclic pyranopterin phosphate synthase